jgi:hypothetical protein
LVTGEFPILRPDTRKGRVRYWRQEKRNVANLKIELKDWYNVKKTKMKILKMCWQ